MTASAVIATAAVVCLALLGAYWVACLMRHKPTIYVTGIAYMAVHVLVGGWGVMGWLQPAKAVVETSILSY
ncbi:hypothetical protein [Azospirillum soli]|uniref:hypothetical protein n=1 Tax=Azospirillum soli TaxID=1304799 RepID=UPI001AE6AF0A|nr:hypothetical protein [Azospirillum soli]MBP2315518.1 hypothetical protein [Azospirillum soli]